MSSGPKVLIVGPGRMGLALAHALARSDTDADVTVCGRHPEAPAHPLFTQRLARYVFGLERPAHGSDAVLLAVPDDAIPEMAHALAGQGDAPDGCAAFHLSDALPTDVLAPLHVRGYAVGSFYPMQVVGLAVTAAERLRGCHVAVTGSPAAVSAARRLASFLDATMLTLPEVTRPQYGAATALAASYLPPLIDAAARVLERAGVPHEEAIPALVHLVRGTLDDIAERGPEAAAGGPAARGDLESVDLHLRALDEDDRRLYGALGMRIVALVGETLDDERRGAVLERLKTAAEGWPCGCT